MSKFIGRKYELELLHTLQKKSTASFIVIMGRRRIGKSCLIEEFSKSFTAFYSFVGLAPDNGVTQSNQLDIFSQQFATQFKAPPIKFANWGDAFWVLGEKLQHGNILLAFDEISWMGDKDPTFLPHIKTFWDQQLKKNSKLMFVICGSASSWINKNILNSTGFVGRISHTFTLKELSLQECSLFWPKNVSSYEKLKILSITGGVPRYLEEINPKLSAEENIKRLCFTSGGMLVNEFNQIFSDIFLRNSQIYKKILEALVSGPQERTELASLLQISSGGRLSEYAYELELAGFITRDFTWNLTNGQDNSLSSYRLKDNYIRFYLRYIDKELTKINRDTFAFQSLTSLTQLNTILGLQFENLVLNNRQLIHKQLQIRPEDIVVENPFYQRKSSKANGCQIDYMIQTKYNTLYVCEIKFSKNLIGVDVIDEVQQKIDNLQRPKGFSCRPVLIHVNGVSDAVIDQDYFVNIIDIAQFLD